MVAGASSLRWKIGPLTTYADAAELQRWFVAAKPGDEERYATGPALGQGNPAALLAGKLAQRGEAQLFQRREGRGFAYIIRKAAGPRQSAGDCARTQRAAPPPYSPEGRVLAAVAQAVDAGEGCPTNEALAEAAGLPGPEQARYRFNRLVESGHLRVTSAPRFGRRKVEIVR